MLLSQRYIALTFTRDIVVVSLFCMLKCLCVLTLAAVNSDYYVFFMCTCLTAAIELMLLSLLYYRYRIDSAITMLSQSYPCTWELIL